MNIFQEATRQQLRYHIDGSTFNTEQLWELPLTSKVGPSLDKLAIKYNAEKTPNEPESFVSDTPKRAETKEAELKFDVVKAVIDVLKQERDDAKTKAEKEMEKMRLLDLKRQKEMKALESLSIEEIDQRLAELK